MTTARRRGILAAVTAIVLLAMGAGVAFVVGDALGIRTEPSAQMQPAAPAVAAATDAAAPPDSRRSTVPDTERVGVAVDELRAAVADAPARAGTASLTVELLDANAADADAADGYTLDGDAAALRIQADERGRARRARSTTSPRQVRAAQPLTDLSRRACGIPASAADE